MNFDTTYLVYKTQELKILKKVTSQADLKVTFLLIVKFHKTDNNKLIK